MRRIVIAKQNEFINIFKAKPKDREEIFNKIFNTQIYKEMYDSFLKVLCQGAGIFRQVQGRLGRALPINNI